MSWVASEHFSGEALIDDPRQLSGASPVRREAQ